MRLNFTLARELHVHRPLELILLQVEHAHDTRKQCRGYPRGYPRQQPSQKLDTCGVGGCRRTRHWFRDLSNMGGRPRLPVLFRLPDGTGGLLRTSFKFWAVQTTWLFCDSLRSRLALSEADE